MSNSISAEAIANALGGRRIKTDRFTACCPAHQDQSPSLSITQKGDRVLWHCFAGCSQVAVSDALRSRGLLPNPREPTQVETLVDRDELLAFCLAHECNLRKKIPTSTNRQRLYRQYQRVLCSPFSPGEISEMDLFCLIYRADVRGGKTPSREEDSTFLNYQRAVYEVGYTPYEW